MKKILLLLTSALAISIIAGCAEEDTAPAPVAELSFEEKISTINVNDVTIDDAIYMTVQSLYNVPEISQTVKDNVKRVYEGLQTGSIFTTPDGSAGENMGMGEVKYPAIASAVFQSLYKTVEASTNTDSSLKRLLTYSALDNETLFNEIIGGLSANQEDLSLINSFVTNFRDYVLSSQDNIVAISEEYVKLLLDSSSSASKTAGGGGVVSAQEYLVSANIAYTFADIAIKSKIALNFDPNVYPEKIHFLANTVYNLSEETKLKITYDKGLVYYNTTDAIDGFNNDLIYQLVASVLNDINTTNQIPGGAPYPATYVVKEVDGVVPEVIEDAAATPNPYVYASSDDGYITADIIVYQSIGKALLASPAGNTIYTGADYAELEPTNMVTNNMLTIYQRLKENGLKAPLYTGEDGAKALTEVIAKYLRDSGIVYLNSNVDANNTAYTALQTLIDALFTPAGGGEAPACALIKEYNKVLDDAAIGRAYNTGYYTKDADGSLCNIYISDTERKNFDSNDYGITAQ